MSVVSHSLPLCTKIIGKFPHIHYVDDFVKWNGIPVSDDVAYSFSTLGAAVNNSTGTAQE